MTLNTFHHAGIASMGTSNLGVGRTREILSLSKKQKKEGKQVVRISNQ